MNKIYNHKIVINKEQSLLRLDQALAKLTSYSRSQIKILLSNDNILKNEEIIKDASYKVKSGEKYIINIKIPELEKFDAEEIPLDIIYEDNEIIVVNKKAGMVVHPSPGHYHGTLVNALINHTKNLSDLNDKNRPGIVHRIDKETSGLIVIAKDNITHDNLANQFKEHTISRKYKAIVWGQPVNQTIEGYIERHKINRKKMSLSKNEKGKYSKTFIKLLKTFEIASLIECELKTGRTHQIRLHLTSLNSPVVGDKVYGKSKISKFGKNKETFNKFLILKNFSRQALHAYHLGFKHPKSNKYIEFDSNLPNDMEKLLELVVKY